MNSQVGSTPISRRQLAIGFGVGIASLTLTACGSGSQTPAAQSSGSSASGGLQKITVGALPIADVAPLHMAKDLGYFAEQGLDVTIENTNGGAAAVPGVVSKSYDFAFGNLVSVMVAADKGLDLRFVVNATSSHSKVGADHAAVMVRADSPLQSAKDLPGTTSTSNQLQNIGDTAIRMSVDAAGADSSKVKFIEIAFPEAANAVEKKQVDSALFVEPFLTMAKSAGLRPIVWPYSEATPNLDTAAYFTSGERVQNEPELVAKFVAAMKKALDFASKNEDKVRESVGTFTQTPPAVLKEMTLPNFRPDFNRASVEALGNAALKYATLTKAPDLNVLLPAS